MQNIMKILKTAIWNRVIIGTNNIVVVSRANEANESVIIQIWIMIIKDNILWQHELWVKPKQPKRMVRNMKVHSIWIFYTLH